MDLSPVPEIRCDWNKDWDKQATNMLLTCFRHVSLPPGSLRRTELPAEQQPCLWALCWAESAESRKRRALPSTLHTPSNLCLGRESSAGNPPYVFLYYKELRRMSSFLFKHPHIAVKQPWLDDEKCHQAYERMPANGAGERSHFWIRCWFWRDFTFLCSLHSGLLNFFFKTVF